ncbi:hypothetical protein M23134_06270 [Microscilla marina ATCC 23134]|uniref:Uncharacterized protein n=1 Tax=Microscilla marina ATCC 23134 TaxID=313606 RepID=A1ZYM5_MICM2|nr:hypothetical protein M23134_06270 [Microscilla marina ATCC 23134]
MIKFIKKIYQKYQNYIKVDLLMYLFMILFIIILFIFF